MLFMPLFYKHCPSNSLTTRMPTFLNQSLRTPANYLPFLLSLPYKLSSINKISSPDVFDIFFLLCFFIYCI